MNVRTLPIDTPVPFVTAWSGEVGYVVRPDPLLDGRLAVFCEAGHRGDGVPLWGTISEERQRLCALRRLCQICGQAAGHPAFAVAMVDVADRGRATPLPIRGHEPLVCEGCLPAAFVCPRVRRALGEDALHVLVVGSYRVEVKPESGIVVFVPLLIHEGALVTSSVVASFGGAR